MRKCLGAHERTAGGRAGRLNSGRSPHVIPSGGAQRHCSHRRADFTPANSSGVRTRAHLGRCTTRRGVQPTSPCDVVARLHPAEVVVATELARIAIPAPSARCATAPARTAIPSAISPAGARIVVRASARHHSHRRCQNQNEYCLFHTCSLCLLSGLMARVRHWSGSTAALF